MVFLEQRRLRRTQAYRNQPNWGHILYHPCPQAWAWPEWQWVSHRDVSETRHCSISNLLLLIAMSTQPQIRVFPLQKCDLKVRLAAGGGEEGVELCHGSPWGLCASPQGHRGRDRKQARGTTVKTRWGARSQGRTVRGGGRSKTYKLDKRRQKVLPKGRQHRARYTHVRCLLFPATWDHQHSLSSANLNVWFFTVSFGLESESFSLQRFMTHLFLSPPQWNERQQSTTEKRLGVHLRS